ncbi:MAG: ATP-binding protein [Calditrichaceae bacterium]|nr:ATP-binding protein [Calditrichaceae bacterium]MBN2708056.1 ATP-binding protein [Calditrichaceae bacterium]RQV92297.1 MAG: ATP-binding protein [Calditrichota bacterium]
MERKQKRQKYQLKISSITENLEIIREFVRNLAIRAGFNDEISDQIVLAVDEACTNVIKHAHHYDARRLIELSVFIDKEKMKIIITDKGKGFDIKSLPRPDIKKYVHESKSGGLGIHLMRSLMDEVSFSFQPLKKNQVELVKYFRKSA